MIPADIDNFIVYRIYPNNSYGSRIIIKDSSHIIIKGLFRKIPKEIGNCSYLTHIYLSNNRIVDISTLSNCSSLKYLDLASNKIVDISALSNCFSLEYLFLDNNKILDVSALYNCSSITYLYLNNNKIKNKIKFDRFKVYY